MEEAEMNKAVDNLQKKVEKERLIILKKHETEIKNFQELTQRKLNELNIIFEKQRTSLQKKYKNLDKTLNSYQKIEINKIEGKIKNMDSKTLKRSVDNTNMKINF